MIDRPQFKDKGFLLLRNFIDAEELDAVHVEAKMRIESFVEFMEPLFEIQTCDIINLPFENYRRDAYNLQE